MIQKFIKRGRRILEFDSSKSTAIIVSPEKATGEFGQRTSKNVDLVENYIQKLDWKVKENSNMSYSLQGLNNFISSDVTSQYWLNRIYPLEIRHAHENGDIHIHDLSMLSAYCVGWDLKDLLKQGFKGVGGKIESCPPKHLGSALGQIVNFFYTLQGEAAGAQAVSNFDTLLAPFVRYDNLDYKQLKQAFQEFVFNMNIPTRVGFQTPFTNLTMDLQVSPILKHCPVIIGGIERNETYSEFQPEMDLINLAFAEVMMEGDARGRPFTFPIPTYNITTNFDWDNPNLELMLLEAKRWGYLTDNPAVELERPRNRDHEIEILTPTELSLLVANTEDHYQTAFRTAIMTGVRAGELWGLQWPDFQPTTKQLFVRRSVWNGQFQTPKTKNAKRAIDLPDELVHELKVWKLRCPPNPHNLMFPSPEGSITQHDNMKKRVFIPALRKAGLHQVSFHSLRHSNASIRIKMGQNLKYLSKQMGHSSVAFTLDVYGHLFADDQKFLREQASLLDGVLPPQIREVTKSDSSKTVAKAVAIQKKGVTHFHVTPRNNFGSGG